MIRRLKNNVLSEYTPTKPKLFLSPIRLLFLILLDGLGLC